MDTFKFSLTKTFKKKVFMYLLQRYLGQFMEEKPRLDQLELYLDMHNGIGTVECVSLDVQQINALGEAQNWPMEIVDGFIEKITVTVPWSSILKEPTIVVINGLKLTVQPKQRTDYATSMFESMWSSMSSSRQLAQECMQESPNLANNKTLDGIENFAQTIDSILSRVKVTFMDTVIQIEHVPKHSFSGVGIQIKINHMKLFDEAGNDPPTGEPPDVNVKEQSKAYVDSLVTCKNIVLDGVSLYTIEFPTKARTFSKSVREQSPCETCKASDLTESDEDEKCTCSHENRHGERSKSNTRHAVLFAKLSGTQEIRIRIKQPELVVGPKVSIEAILGTFTILMSPRQLFVLIELVNGLTSPDLEDTSNLPPKHKCMQKPLTGLDFQRIEQELQNQMQPTNLAQGKGLQGTSHGWSTSAQDDDDSLFLPLRGKTTASMIDSTVSNASSSMESSLTSSLTSSVSEVSSKARRKSHNIEADPTAEISHFQIRISSISVLLLHEDIIAVSPDNLRIIPASVGQMQNISKTFFNEHPYQTGYGAKDIEKVSVEYDKKLRDMNHLRLLAAPVHLEVKETTTNTAFSVNGKLTMAKVELIESVTNGQENLAIVKLLSFSSANNLSASPSNSRPQLSLNFKHNEKTGKPGILHVPAPKTDIEIGLDSCSIELDITLIDRLRALLDRTPVCVIDKEGQELWRLPSTTSLITHTESEMDIKLTSPSVSIKLRFPIPDLRPHSDPNRVPWYKRNVRLDYLTLQISDASFVTSIQTAQLYQKYTLDFRLLDILYHENDAVSALPIARIESDQKLLESLGYNGITAFPKIILKINPVINSDIELHHVPEAEFDTMCQSIYGNLIGEHTKEPSPFSSKRVIHESDNPHTRTQADDPDELIIPGDKQEMEDFIANTANNSRIELEMHLPVVSLQLLTKHIYEVIYNRINSDLLLWEPSAPRNCHSYANENLVPFAAPREPDTFGMCKSGINNSSESESDDDNDPATIFYSAYERTMRAPRQPSKDIIRQSHFALNIHIKLGLVGMNSPVRDLQSNVIPNQQGEFVFRLYDVGVFNVNGYNGDINLGYVCAFATRAEVYHCDMRSTPSQSPPLLEIDTIMAKHLHSMIYRSDTGVLQESTNRGGKRDMVSVAVKVQANHETHQVKTITVAIGIDKATLKHRMCLEPNTWISQLMDFFNVVDYTITGYNAKEVLTELHLHLWDCAIDYRPKFLPLRSVITLGSFTLSSHIAAQSCSSTLRFLAEDCGLFLSEKAPPRNGKPSEAAVDLRRDYVNVVQLGLFEISLKLHDEKSGIYPLVDLRAANNMLHIRTCADSGRALMQLITYLAAYGDTVKSEEGIPVSPVHEPEQQLVPIEPSNASKLSDSQHEQINKEITEAMEDVDECPQQDISEHQGTGAKLFFFPDEKNRATRDANFVHVSKSQKGDVVPLRTNLSSDTDDEFCFIDIVGTGGTLNQSTPEVIWKTDVPVRLIDRYFAKPGKMDFLKTPSSYPLPVSKYTLREMSIIWDMYGGNDFKSTTSKEAVQKKTVNFADTSAVSFSNANPGEVVFNANKKETKKRQNVGWPLNGGVNRDQNVLMQLHLNKVRFQHDLFPEHTVQASRQVLVVTEIEVKDKLACSEINKFLYEYSTEENPKRSHSHMLSVKVIHTRPDPAFKTEECELKISMLPLRLNIDQDSFLFLVNFFGEMTSLPDANSDLQVPSKHSTPTHQPPVISKSRAEQKSSEPTDTTTEEDLLSLTEERIPKEDSLNPNAPADDCIQDSSPIFFKSVMFSPEVSIRIDYHGKRVDMSHGPLPGLLMGIGHLNCSIIKLRELINNRGILGVDSLFQFLWSQWLEDIKKNQIPGVLGGIGPMHALLQLFQGIWDLFWMPIEQYQKDGRIVRGIQRGANSFTKSTLVATLELASRIIHLVLITAETAFDMLSSGKSIKRLRYNQPQDLREGVSYAYNVVREGFGEAASNLVYVASHEHEQKGYTGAVGGIIRQIPPTIIQPIIIASNATNNVLGGMRCQLAPDIRQEVIDKWKKDESKK